MEEEPSDVHIFTMVIGLLCLRLLKGRKSLFGMTKIGKIL